MAKKNIKPVEETVANVVSEEVEAPVVKEEAPEVKPVESKKGKVINCERLNVRKGPSTDYEVVSVLTVDTVVPIAKEGKEWYRVPGGYVMAKYIKTI